MHALLARLDAYGTDDPDYREGHPEDRCPLCGRAVDEHPCCQLRGAALRRKGRVMRSFCAWAAGVVLTSAALSIGGAWVLLWWGLDSDEWLASF